MTQANKKKMIAFGWYGGKFSHLKWLLPLLPESTHFCDVFGGSAAVIINRVPSPVETYNDIDGEVVNFFKMLRDNKDELIRLIGLTPFSKEELKIASEKKSNNSKLSEMERARLFFVRARQTRTGLAQMSSKGRWAHCRLTSRAGMAGAVSRWLGSVEGLAEVAQRLLRIQIENEDAIKLIKRYDSKETLFYCDPPYPHESRGDTNAYAYEMTNKQHRDLADVLNNIEGKCAISGYHCDLMNELYGHWNVNEAKEKNAPSIQKKRIEVLWTNYKPNKQPFKQGKNTNGEKQGKNSTGEKQFQKKNLERFLK